MFLGIQAANWNEQRAENAKAQAYLARIRGNLLTDLLSIERREVFWRKVIDDGKAAIHYAESGELVQGSAWKTVLAFYQASQLWQWVPSDATYQEMRSGGELGLIRDETCAKPCPSTTWKVDPASLTSFTCNRNTARSCAD